VPPVVRSESVSIEPAGRGIVLYVVLGESPKCTLEADDKQESYQLRLPTRLLPILFCNAVTNMPCCVRRTLRLSLRETALDAPGKFTRRQRRVTNPLVTRNCTVVFEFSLTSHSFDLILGTLWVRYERQEGCMEGASWCIEQIFLLFKALVES
jgi:hypothetical protein